MLSRLSSRERNLLILLLVIGLAFLFYKFILQGQIVKNAELKEVYAQETAKLDQSKQIANSLEDITFSAKNSDKELESVKARFTTKANDGSSEIKLGKDANSDAVKVVLFQPLPIIQNEDYVELPISMAVEGEYFAIIDFLTSIEGFFNLTEVKELHIRNEKKQDFAWNPNLKATFTFSIYTTNPPEEESSYSDLTQWTVGRLNSFTVGVRALAKWNAEKTEGTNNQGTGTEVGSGGEGSSETPDDGLPPEGSNDLGVLK